MSIPNPLGIPTIDLLKIDTESDELAILEGISEVHYPLIRQIAIAVHSNALAAEIQPLLTDRGFRIISNAGIASGNNIYAVRK